ncbi:MAG: hypothetical protein Tsb0017_01040 [Geothermobacteraceae bacterium]
MADRFNPKVRLLFAIGVMAVAFGDSRPAALLVLSVILASVALWCHCRAGFWLPLLRRLRWLLLASLLLHLFFFPGHTLAGIAWLSRDGLERGVVLCWQMLLAFGAAGLLAHTTSGREQAGALVQLLSPVGRFFPPAGPFLRLVPTAVGLLPEVRRQTALTWAEQDEVRNRLRRGGLLYRARAAGELVEQLVLALADLGEQQARARASGARHGLPDTIPLTPRDRRGLALLIILLLVWLAL